MNARQPSHFLHAHHVAKDNPKRQKTGRSKPYFPFKSFPLNLSIYCPHLHNKEESNSRPANTHSTDPTAPACITYSQPPPSSGSFASAGLFPTIFSYSCGPTQTTKIYLATATNAPASASTSSHHPITFTHLPIYAYVGIGIGGIIVLILLGIIGRKSSKTPTRPAPSAYRCRHCLSTDLSYRTVQPGNRNGNAGRPYCVCVNPDCPGIVNLTAGQHDTGWVTWLDGIGVRLGNPLCRCQRSARQDTAGERSGAPGRRFWTCSTGACGYESWRLDGKELWGPGF